MQDRSLAISGNDYYKEYQKSWRLFMPMEALSLGFVGYSIYKEDQENLPKIITDLFVVAGIRWIVRDGIYQVLHSENFWKLPDTKNTYLASLENLGTPLIKISFLLAVLIFKYFILPEL